VRGDLKPPEPLRWANLGKKKPRLEAGAFFILFVLFFI
jgi:hypothetical protein